MNMSTPHILYAIALLVTLFGGGVLWFPNSDGRVAYSGFGVALLLVCVAGLVS